MSEEKYLLPQDDDCELKLHTCGYYYPNLHQAIENLLAAGPPIVTVRVLNTCCIVRGQCQRSISRLLVFCNYSASASFCLRIGLRRASRRSQLAVSKPALKAKWKIAKSKTEISNKNCRIAIISRRKKQGIYGYSLRRHRIFIFLKGITLAKFLQFLIRQFSPLQFSNSSSQSCLTHQTGPGKVKNK